ncbi:YdeI/OmpD-associated family protein [Neptunitalea lumnitzerae]|uniref:YdhG-like domain-containing protein n=1 Tax=Neptunitalea lumnitzerae TaxID=2965509 RepID=A0ABQ5MK27_9FLAO|nr:DUF1801 domain-containing protein [Neptunitalea sp. Y10]GLB49770.1 hypothetical protein Y10_21380 [Neptunitalea sp. Y10]
MDKVAAYLEKHSTWKTGLEKIRTVLLQTELEETIKWGAPTYTINNKNIVGLGAFKNHFGIWFFQGALLKDTKNVLLNAQEGKTKALRQWRFESNEDINEALILTYVQEAIENQLKGLEIKPERSKKIAFDVDPIFKEALKKSEELTQAFDKLTPGKQKEYANHILEAKREATKVSRLEKITPMILQGVGLHDKYKNC